MEKGRILGGRPDVRGRQRRVRATRAHLHSSCHTDTPLSGGHVDRRRTVGQKPVKAAKTLGMFWPPESLNSARIERMTPSMDSSFSEQSIDGVIRHIRALFNDSGGRNMPRVLAAFTGFWPTVRPRARRRRGGEARRRAPEDRSGPPGLCTLNYYEHFLSIIMYTCKHT